MEEEEQQEQQKGCLDLFVSWLSKVIFMTGFWYLIFWLCNIQY